MSDSEILSPKSPLEFIPTSRLAYPIQVYRAVYRRRVPLHYRDNPLTRESVLANVILVEGGALCVPTTPEGTFFEFFQRVKETHPQLQRHIISPRGTARAAGSVEDTPIKALAHLASETGALPGEREVYGWRTLEDQAIRQGMALQLLFQANGQYFNRGSALYDGIRVRAQPDMDLAEILENGPSEEERERLGLEERSLKRPMLFFLSLPGGEMSHLLFRFDEGKPYLAGIRRLEDQLRQLGVTCAMAASPPVVLPDENGLPGYITLEEMISGYHANDVRHYLYCPYEGAVLLYAELSRAQSQRPEALARSLSGRVEDRLPIPLRETLGFVSQEQLDKVLKEKGYAGRYHFSQEDKSAYLHLNLLEGVYSHLAPFLTRAGVFGILQTSGTRAAISGNDGPTYRQLAGIFQHLNSHPPFDGDPIIAAASGSQGNDVPNVVALSREGVPGLLHELAPQIGLDGQIPPRGVITTPRAGLAVRKLANGPVKIFATAGQGITERKLRL